MGSRESELELVAERLRPVSHHVSLRGQDSDAYVFAVGTQRLHSLEVRTEGSNYRLAFWRGPDGEDVPCGERTVPSIEAAVAEAEGWLLNDRI